ncbi:Helix-turn-helix domain-containing protein [Geodermatophilus obscurus]|uniref:Helix-turn-helix domain-containing protein n=1 Tax=Geodermatophilus obscurus TaxID=1861 RepID=A0A1M7UC42_9ACTN|nr:helix-turn-helix domain-containing protein [Geodermatophilus obscurus]SHN80544.1 Helix-turn-helix domain-containing protein [Geodermatophilus obscurus]
MATADLLLHPVRLRIVQAFLGDRALTTADLRGELPDVPLATLYRHVGVLAEAGVLAVVGERKVRGAAERSYRLVTEAASVGAADAAAMSVDEHRRAFATFVAALLADFDRYADAAAGPGLDPAADGVGYRQVALWLDDEEFTGLVTELRAVLTARLALQPGGARRRRIVSQVFLPG